jgi:hypothetical protein
MLCSAESADKQADPTPAARRLSRQATLEWPAEVSCSCRQEVALQAAR